MVVRMSVFSIILSMIVYESKLLELCLSYLQKFNSPEVDFLRGWFRMHGLTRHVSREEIHGALSELKRCDYLNPREMHLAEAIKKNI